MKMTIEEKKRGAKPGKANGNYSHGEAGTPLYIAWKNMRARCHRPKATGYKCYGARGISVCDEWRYSYKAFSVWAWANGYAEGLEIDRIDNNGNYCPSNCRWITHLEQSYNKRMPCNNTSGFFGVDEDKRYQTWKARITVAGKRKYLGSFPTKEDAAAARDLYIIENELPHRLSDPTLHLELRA